MQDLNHFAANIEFIDGIWYSIGESKISYPEEGNSTCFQLEDESFWFNHRNSVIVETLKKFPYPEGYLLDVGGGNGFVSSAIERSGMSVVLVEPGEKGIQNAKKRGVSKLVCSSLEDMKIKDLSIPAIGLFDVLEHIENDNDFLAQIHKILIVGGRIYLTVPAYDILWSNEDIYAGHFRRYDLKKIKSMLQRAGFIIEYKTFFFSILPFPVFFFRSLPFRMGFSRKENFKKHVNDHSKKTGITGRILNSIWSWEIKKIKRGETIPFGGSCLVVGRKVLPDLTY